MTSSITPFEAANTRAGTIAPATNGYDTSPKNGRARYGPRTSASGPDTTNPTSAQPRQRRAGQRRYSDDGVAWSTRATIESATSTTTASIRRHVATGDAGSAHAPATCGAGSVPHTRLTATGSDPAHVQRTGADRRTAIAVPTARSSSTTGRRTGLAAASASSAIGTIERRKSF